MLKKTLIALACILVPSPALAYPTSLISIPTAECGSSQLHFGHYSYANGSLDFSVNAGIFDGIKLGDTRVGGLEIGFDAMHPRSTINSVFAGSAKLGLLSETDVLPSLAVGCFYPGIPDPRNTPNFGFLAATKAMTPLGIDCGQWTVGGFHLSPGYSSVGNNGFFAGFSRGFTERIALVGDFISGDSGMGGANLALSYAISEDFSLTSGYYFSSASLHGGDGPNSPFLYLDYTIPFKK